MLENMFIIHLCLFLAYAQEQVTGFSWHPTQENKLLTISASGVVKRLNLFEKITLVSIACQAVKTCVLLTAQPLLMCCNHQWYRGH